MVLTDEEKLWTDAGGSVQQVKGRKVYITDAGKELKSWRQAKQHLDNATYENGKEQRDGAATEGPPAKRAKGKPVQKASNQVAQATENDENTLGHSARQSRTAKKVTYTEASDAALDAKMNEDDSCIETVEQETCDNEADAICATAASDSMKTDIAQRRITSFAIINTQSKKASSQQSVTLLRIGLPGSEPCYLTGVMHPAKGAMTKGNGRALTRPIGPITSWNVAYSGNEPSFQVSTESGIYNLEKPTGAYQHVFQDVLDQARLCHTLVQSLQGKEAQQKGWSEVLADISRSKVVGGFTTVCNALVYTGPFIVSQLEAMQKAVGGSTHLADTAFVTSLRNQIVEPPLLLGEHPSQELRLQEPNNSAARAPDHDRSLPELTTCEAVDTYLARRLQAKMEAEEQVKAQRGHARQPAKSQTAYIKIHPREIADDYPDPKVYTKTQEEIDELLLYADEDIILNVNPDALPRMFVDDFAAYDEEGFMSTLELLPMWQNVPPDVNLFFSGFPTEQGSESDQFSAGFLLALDDDAKTNAGASNASADASTSQQAGSSAGAGASSSAHASSSAMQPDHSDQMRMFSAPIQEWMIECCADRLFIWVRTDCCWYQIRSVADAYQGWFDTVLKVARIAVHMLQRLAGANAGGDKARVGRTSFADVVKHIASLPTTSPLHISSRVEKVQRFLVAHGQIILNQFKNFPVKSIQRSPIVAELKQAMSARRHSNLYMSKRDTFQQRARGENPVKSQSVSTRPKPMTATATHLVKGIWHDYFKDATEGGPEGVAKEAEEDENEDDDEDDLEAGAAAAPKQGAKDAKQKAPPPPPERPDVVYSQAIKGDQVVVSEELSSDGPMKLFKKVTVGDTEICIGELVELNSKAVSELSADDDEEGRPILGLVQAVYKKGSQSAPQVQVREMLTGWDTMLHDTASLHEIFMTPRLASCAAASITGKCRAHHLKVPFGAMEVRDQAIAAVHALIKDNAELKAQGQPLQLLYRMLYDESKAMFSLVPDDLSLGQYAADDAVEELVVSKEDGSFLRAGQRYSIGDFVYISFSPVKSRSSIKPARKSKQRKEAEVDSESDTESEDESDAEVINNESRDERVQRRNALRQGDSGAAAPQSERSAENKDDKQPAPNSGAAKAGGHQAPKKAQKPARKSAGSKKAAACSSTAPAKAARQADAAAAAAETAAPQADVAAAAEEATPPADAAAAVAAAGKAAPSADAAADGKANAEGGEDLRSMETWLNAAWYKKYHAADLNGKPKSDLEGVKAYVVGLIEEVHTAQGGRADSEMAKCVTVRIFDRPEDISADLAYEKDAWTVYKTDRKAEFDVQQLEGVCVVTLDAKARTGAAEVTGQTHDVFHCAGGVTIGKGGEKAVNDAVKPADLVVAKKKRSPPAADAAACSKAPAVSIVPLPTLDIFAGCGGLSEGMHEAGAAITKWAIEYWEPAFQAFCKNNPDAKAIHDNCNVLLHRAMCKAGAADQCDASEECVKQSESLDEATAAKLPVPGEVGFICGGPPCQGYSGMNRFNNGNWSLVQNSMVMSYLSYCDFYRPEFWLLENVRNFVCHQKSLYFKLTIRCLLEMGYQVRFAVLNAGNFGVSQSRKRTFIWAAAPGQILPDWPRPFTAFNTPQLPIKLHSHHGDVTYNAVTDAKHARLRAVTVRDAIGDLPRVNNGCNKDEVKYDQPAISTFQKQIRGGAETLRDHICKTMNPLNLHRCTIVPTNMPGADWRSLIAHVHANPEKNALFVDKENGKAAVPLVPFCLPNTASKHNGWRGLYGRLAWAGHFPTSVTDPNPMGKVGQVFHPEQHRIVSVRECARAQGFPDSFIFWGSVHDKHKEVGNAVPPPLGAAIGRMLRRSLEQTAVRVHSEIDVEQFLERQ